MIKRVFIFVLAFSLLVSGGVMASEAQYGGTLRLSNDTNWDTLDPAYASGFDAGDMASKIFDGLVRFDYHSNDIVNSLAESWEASNENQTFVFKLREGVEFHNGRELTAHDVKYTFDRLYDPEVASPGTWVFSMIKGTDAALDGETDGLEGVTVIDDYTVQFDLDYPFGLFVTHLTLPYGFIVPEEVVNEHGDQFSQNPVGTGPWVFESWDHDDELVLKANEDYFDGRPYVDEVIYRVIPQSITDIAEFEAGNLDYTGIPVEERERWLNNEEWEPYTYSMAELSSYYIALNQDFEPLDDPLVREAIDYAIDSEQITEALFSHYVAAKDAIPEGMDGGSPNSEFNYDPDRARELLAEAGYPDGFELELWVSSGTNPVRAGGVVQAMLTQVGIDVELVKNDWSVFFDTVRKGNAPSYYLSWWADYADPYNFLQALYASDGSRINYENVVVDEILEEMGRTTSVETRVELSERLIDMVSENGDPYVWLYHTSSSTIKQPWVNGELHHQMYHADKLTTWWIDQDKK
ncbi:MAG: ABC transporter substrate-binding protein [Halarsenatibacteraceae bacterium]